MTSGSTDKGKDTEVVVQGVLDGFNSDVKTFSYHRYPDTKAASRGSKINTIAAQPSDWLVAYQKISRLTGALVRQSWHLEAKETVKTTSLPLGKVRQYPMLKKFWWAGIEPVLIVNRVTLSDWVLIREERLFPGCSPFEMDTNPTPKSFEFAGLYSFKSAKDALQFLFDIR